MAATFHVFHQFVESTLSAYRIVKLMNAVHADPNGVGLESGEGLLCIGGHGGGEKADFVRKVDEIVEPTVAIAPQGRFAALEIHEAGAQLVRVEQFLFDLLVTFDGRVFVIVNAAVRARQVALIGDEQHGLQRFAPFQEFCLEVPVAEVEEHHFF